MEGDNFCVSTAIGNIATTLAMCNGLSGRSREARKPFFMSEWKGDSDGEVSFGAWVAEQLGQKTECDVTEHLEQVLNHTAGKWRRRFQRRRADWRQTWRSGECL
jgi:hypothetical protein